MKYFVFSDLHGSLTALQKVEQLFTSHECDAYLFLGDLLYHGPRNPLPEGYNPKKVAEIIKTLDVPFIWIKGNCDAEVDEMVTGLKAAPKALINIGTHQILCVHGHHLSLDEKDLFQVGDNDIVLYGHYHIYDKRQIKNTTFINIGSCSLPKDDKKQYAIIDNKITVYDWDDKIVGELDL